MTINFFHQVRCRKLPVRLFGLSGLLAGALTVPTFSGSCIGLEKQLAQAMSALEQGRDAEAEQLLTGMQSSNPECHDVILGLGRLRMAQGDAISAQKLLSLYTELEAKDAKGYYFLSNLLFSQRSFQRAESMLARALLLHPDYPEALTLQGQLLSMRGQFTSAEEALSKACRLAPEDVPAHFELGKLYDSQHKSAQAVTVFEKVITLNPKDPRAYDYLALNLDAVGNTERAESIYKKGLEVNHGPLNDSFLDYNFGRFLMAQNRLSEARRHLDRAVGLAPKTRAVYYERAKLNLRFKNYAEARRDAEQALSLRDPTGFVLDLQVYSQLATIYARLGEKELAGKYAKLSKETPIPLDGYKMVR